MKKRYFTIATLFITLLSFGQGLGDFIITGFNSDNPDQVSFITAVDVPGSKEISITDNGWFSAGGFRDTEGIAIWTAPVAGVDAGTEILIDFTTDSVNIGTITPTDTPNLSSSGDQIFFYHTDNVPDSNANQSGFIAAMSIAISWGSNATSSNNSALPSIFTEGTDAFTIILDNGMYNCDIGTDPQTAAALRASIYDDTNWDTSNSIHYTLATCGLVLPVSKQEIIGFSMYPNPVTNGEFSIKPSNNSERSVQIYDMLGKQVYSKIVSSSENVQVANLNTGIYILKVLEEGKTATRKLVIE